MEPEVLQSIEYNIDEGSNSGSPIISNAGNSKKRHLRAEMYSHDLGIG
jgi:hypothetical protein